MLNKKQIKYEITNELGRTQSTIAGEINLHNVLKLHGIYKTLIICLIVNTLIIAKSVQINDIYFNRYYVKKELEYWCNNNCSELKINDLDDHFLLY